MVLPQQASKKCLEKQFVQIKILKELQKTFGEKDLSLTKENIKT